jgi:sugar-specific transcriptional regulator TrmB
MADGLDQARRAIEDRLRELDSESKRLREALSKLEPNGNAPRSRSSRTRTRGAGSARRAGRGERQQQFLAAVKKHPGAKPPEIAKEMGVEPSHVYTLARRLHESGKIRKRRGGGYALKS